ncbi:hypothetical protein IJ670_07530, partial [bacterium]|nr:hypothetical protein [bacterium]
MELYFISLFLLVFGGILSIFVKKENKMKLCSVFVGISSLLLSILALNSLITGNLYGARFYISDFFKNTDFIIDPLSAFFILVICLMSFLASLYSVGYIKPYFNKNLN